MRTKIVKKYLCLITVLLFLVPSVTALSVSNNTKVNESFDSELSPDIPEVSNDNELVDDITDNDLILTERMSVEVQELLKKYTLDELDPTLKEYLVSFNEKMLIRRTIWTQETPTLPYIPLDITKLLATYDSETGEIIPTFPGASLKQEAGLAHYSYDPYSPLTVSLYSTNTEPTQTSNPRGGSRAATPADLSVTGLSWTAVNSGWGNTFEADTVEGNQYQYGGFQVGKPTTITASVLSNSPTNTFTNVKVNFTIRDWFSGIPMQRNPVTKLATISGVTTDVSFTFTPPFGGRPMIQANVDYEGDTDASNNGVYWTGQPIVFIWSADFESGGTNFGWQKLTDGTTTKTHTNTQWTGDKGTVNQWHVTNTPGSLVHQQSNEHTQSRAFYHGEDKTQDEYSDTENRHMDDKGMNKNHTYLESPQIDMGDLVDGQEYLGDLPEDNFYPMYTPFYGSMATGRLEIETDAQNTVWYLDRSDFVSLREYADNAGGDNWNDAFNVDNPNNVYVAYGRVWGEYETIFQDQTTPHWNPVMSGIGSGLYPGYPLEIFAGDGSGGQSELGGADNWSRVRFRCDFTGDGDTLVDIGAYLDDFATWGWQDYLVENRVGFTEVTYPETSNIPVLYKDSSFSFTTDVKNWGKAQQIDVEVTIRDKDGNAVFGPTTRKTDNVPKDGEDSISWSWSPDEEGDYTLTAICGDYDKDWTPSDNKEEYYLHVGPVQGEEDVDILVVDDDNSGGQGGIFAIDTEDAMLLALRDNDMKYRVYTVGFNETGPTASAVMSEYECVIWMTGLDNEYTAHAFDADYKATNKAWDVTLKASDMAELESFLSTKGNKLWMISPGFLYDQYGGGSSITESDSFANQKLHIDRCHANMTDRNLDGEIVQQGTQNPLEGVADSVMDGAEYATYDMPDVPFRFDDIGGWVTKDITDKETDQITYQDENHYNYNALIYKGTDFMSAYFAFNFYLINNADDRKDCAYRILTGFGMTGGVEIAPFDNSYLEKLVYPGEEVAFRFKVTNTGKRQDTMVLSVTKPTEYSNWETRFEIDNVQKSSVAIPGLGTKAKIYLYVKAPEMDKPTEYPTAGSLVEFTVKAVSENTNLEDSTIVKAKVGAVGVVTIDCSNPTATIDVDGKAEFSLDLLNETNGVEDIVVSLSFSGNGKDLAEFVENNIPKAGNEIKVTLEPNVENDDIEIQVSPEEHTLAGYHNLTVTLKDENEEIIIDTVDLSVKVNPFYLVRCTTDGDLDENEVNFTIDPNDYTDEGEDYIKKSFLINVQNFGNGYDNIKLNYEENDDSEDTTDWMFGIVPADDPDYEENLTAVNVRYYDVTNIPKYGEEEIQFDIYIPMDVEVNTYIIDFIIDSSHTEPAGEGEDNLVSFKFDIIKPNLRYTNFNTRDNADNFRFYDYYAGERIVRNYELDDIFYIEKKYNEFDDLSIELEIFIDNIGDNEIDLDPMEVWVNITYEDEWGDTIYVENLTARYPTEAKLIEPDMNETFKFYWEFIEQERGTEIEYTFTITVDPEEKIYEKDEFDNTDEVKLTINHLKKPKRKSDTPGFEGIFMIMAIAIMVICLYAGRRQYRKRKD